MDPASLGALLGLCFFDIPFGAPSYVYIASHEIAHDSRAILASHNVYSVCLVVCPLKRIKEWLLLLPSAISSIIVD